MIHDNELTINHPLMAMLKTDLDAAMQLAVQTATGNNTVTVTMKITLENVDVDPENKRRIVHDLNHNIKVAAKNNIWDHDQDVPSFVSTCEDGVVTAIDLQEEISNDQIRIDELLEQEDARHD